MSPAYFGLRAHFGAVLGARIYACAIIQGEKLAAKEGNEDMDESDFIRFTLGMVKRMRRQATENGQSMTWDNAVERLEMEQVEGRHYAFKGSLSRVFTQQVNAEAERQSWAEVDTFAKSLAGKCTMWSIKVEEEAERLEAMVIDKASDASDASIMLAEIFASWTPRRLSWFTRVLAGIRRGAELTKAQRDTISGDYTPKGVTATEFVELAVRYA